MKMARRGRDRAAWDMPAFDRGDCGMDRSPSENHRAVSLRSVPGYLDVR